MGIPFDHSQYLLDSNMILGSNTTTIVKTGTFTDEEFWRSWFDPGLVGVYQFLEMELAPNGFSTPGSSLVSWKWEIRPFGQAAWVNIFTSGSSTWPSNLERLAQILFEPAGDLEDDVPFEIRMLITTAGAETVNVIFANTGLAVRAVGESI